MIVNLFCPQCVKEHTDNLDETSVAVFDVPTPISKPTDNGVYRVVCAKGHESDITVTNLKYDILFELGLNSMLDGGYRDAILNFTSSLEKFYEFFCKSQLHSAGCSDEAINAAWKPVSKFSERQLGAYIGAYSNLTKSSPSLLNPNREVRIRNDVIHNGYIPKENEAFQYAESIASLMYSASDELLSRIPASVSHIYNTLSPFDPDEDGEVDWTKGACNIITAMDIEKPCMSDKGPIKNVREHLERIERDRGPTRMFISSSEASLDLLRKNS